MYKTTNLGSNGAFFLERYRLLWIIENTNLFILCRKFDISFRFGNRVELFLNGRMTSFIFINLLLTFRSFVVFLGYEIVFFGP